MINIQSENNVTRFEYTFSLIVLHLVTRDKQHIKLYFIIPNLNPFSVLLIARLVVLVFRRILFFILLFLCECFVYHQLGPSTKIHIDGHQQRDASASFDALRPKD